MDLKKLNLLRLGKTEREIDHDKELEKMAKELEKKKKAVVAIVRSPGWKVIEDYINAKNEVLRDKLEKKDDPEARALLKLNREFFGFLNSVIADV